MKKPVNHSLRAAMFALITWIPLTLYGLSVVYTRICIPATTTMCNKVPMGGYIDNIGIIFLALAIIAGLISIAYASEAIARREKQKVAYSALAVLMVGAIVYASGVFEVVVLNLLN